MMPRIFQPSPATLIKVAWAMISASVSVVILAAIVAHQVGDPDIGPTGWFGISVGLVGLGFAIPMTRRRWRRGW